MVALFPCFFPGDRCDRCDPMEDSLTVRRAATAIGCDERPQRKNGVNGLLWVEEPVRDNDICQLEPVKDAKRFSS